MNLNITHPPACLTASKISPAGSDKAMRADYKKLKKLQGLIAAPILVLAFVLPLPENGAIAGLPVLCPYDALTGSHCPGTGLTRAVVYAAHGLWSQSFAYHPLGMPVLAALQVWVAACLIPVTWHERIRSCLPQGYKTYVLSSFAWITATLLMIVWLARLAGIIPIPLPPGR